MRWLRKLRLSGQKLSPRNFRKLRNYLMQRWKRLKLTRLPTRVGDLVAEAPVAPQSEEAPLMLETDPEAETELAGEDEAETDEDEKDGESGTGSEDLGIEEEGETPPLPWDDEGEDELPLPEFDESSLSFWRQDDEPLTPVVPGMVVAGRYLVVEALDVQEDEILYHVRDLQRCWQCDYEDNAPDEAFCTQCGAALDRKVDARLWEVRDEEAEPASGEWWLSDLLHEGRYLCGSSPARTGAGSRIRRHCG